MSETDEHVHEGGLLEEEEADAAPQVDEVWRFRYSDIHIHIYIGLR